LAIELQQSPFLSLVSDERIRQTLLLMGRPADAPLTADVAREICVRTGSAAVLEGAISSLGNQYVLWLKARSCSTGTVIDEEQVQARRKEEVLNTLSQIARRFRSQVGESLATVEKHSAPLAEATTPSLEALRAFSAGRKRSVSTGSLSLYKHAIEIDPQFATAYAWLGRAYGDIGESDLSAESTNRAYQLRDRASDAERYFITASYDVVVTGNLEKAQQTCELWAQAYPRDAVPHRMLAGIVYRAAGQYEKSVEEAKKDIELDPDAGIAYRIAAGSYQDLDRLEDAEKILRRASDRKLEIPQFVFTRYDIAFLKGDKPGMEREAALGQEEPAAHDWIYHHQSMVLAYSGRLQQARKMSGRAADMARQANHRERAALFETGEALREAFFGNALDARRSATAALEVSKDREVAYPTAFALAISGDAARAQTLADDLARRFPEDTTARSVELPTLRALLAMNHGDPARAIELLQIAVPYDLSAPRSNIHGFFGGLYPVYVRGEAYLAAHQGVEAVAEFQKILDHRGIVFSDPIGALAHLQLARAFVLAGNPAKAKTAYQDFLTLWNEADPDVPILMQAKVEYAKLQ
jgi:tetratricopeptide (TPR) repeat protein